MTGDRDNLFASPVTRPGPFVFDEQVVRVFPDMIRRSVPGYATVLAMTGLLAARHAQPGTRLYDLGCSLGASTLAMRQALRTPDCTIIAVDNSEAMLDRCRSVIDSDSHDTPVELWREDLEHTRIEAASVVVLNYTLQFVAPERRAAVIRSIYRGLQPGGILILSEKVRFPDPALDALNREMHHDFKRAQGYSDLEIAGKRDAIDNVLIPDTLETHRQRLADCGFPSAEVWFQCFNFASLVALR